MQVSNQSAQVYRGVVVARWASWLIIALALSLGIACVQAVPTEIPTPTPTPTPVPTPTVPPPPAGSAPLLDDSGPDPDKLLQMLRLLSKLPEGYSKMVVVDVNELAQTSALEKSVDLADFGLPRMLLPLLTYSLDMVVLAVPDDGNGSVVVFQGGVELEALVTVARSLGMSIYPDPEIYQGNRMWSGQAFGLTALSLADLGGNTGVVAQGPVTDHSVPERLVKDVFDAAEANSPTSVLVGGPVFWSLVGELPSGPVTVLADECRTLASLHSNVTFAGCASTALTVIEANEDELVAYLVVGFGTEVQAEAAFPLLREGLDNSEIQLGDIAIRQDGVLLKAKMVGDTQEILAVLKDIS